MNKNSDESQTGEQQTVTDRFGSKVPAELDGVDVRRECPECGDDENPWIQQPAGYYTCPTCYSKWAGDPEDASIVSYLPYGEGEANA